ncbi:MAG: biotin/lipoyl-binding protein, partial [Eubacteriales bacterium]|nr:biotin/lipoyl-binding protein [Eubacteriales bacterium]
MSKFFEFFKSHRRTTIIAVVAILAVSVILGALAFQNMINFSSQKEPNVTVLAQKDLNQVITTKGVLQSTDSQFVFTRLSTKVNQVLVKTGDVVNVGDVLARLDPTDYQQSVDDIYNLIADTEAQQKALL